ncbi:LysE family translocator [Aliamphritea hakodatensis]|uniref:LysE family translocator n=1 Tax=Aliamphritea hakodatensis TaxID=2895352 RepID=UPI0022FD929F|nr:LysE family translocator [Aliamphritea hakodatensis]
MQPDTWLAYALACTLLSLIPGPSVLLTTGVALTRSLSAAFMCIAGGTVGSAILIILSLLGVSAILETSAMLFMAVKWAGVIYLAYLGISQIKQARQTEVTAAAASDTAVKNSFVSGFFTALLNPKSIVFYMAFLSQFFDPSGNHLLQYSVLILTALASAALVLTGYALLATSAKALLANKQAQRKINYLSGGFYLSSSAIMAATK